MDRLFEDSFVRPSRVLRSVSGVQAIPLDVYQTQDQVVVKATLPGVKPDEVELTITGETLTIKGQTKSEEVKSEDCYCQEISYGSFARSITLPGQLQTGKAEAKFENGVLTVTIPKAEEAKPKQIKIDVKGVIEGKK
jgi:HSP20 family protein